MVIELLILLLRSFWKMVAAPLKNKSQIHDKILEKIPKKR
ncbi:hypothetical protein BN193_05425 [Lactococcus raffinolactis 4877]|nr:hypothetical protein BN193_05425 [Lactococcus raffinolactis 4877]